MRRSKVDQEGAGVWMGIPLGLYPVTCPMRAVRAWLDEAGVIAGPIFRRMSGHELLEQGLESSSKRELVFPLSVRPGAEAGAHDGGLDGHRERLLIFGDPFLERRIAL